MFHSLSPVSKTVWLVCVSVLAFVLPDPLWLSLLFLSVLSVGLAARLGWGRLLDAMRPLRPLLLIMLFSPAFMLLPGLQELSPGSSPPMLLLEGIMYGLTLTLRFACMIYSALIFLMTTKMKDFVYSMARLGVPYRYAYMVITVFRLIPLFETEVNNVRHAQMARGLGLEKTGVLRKYANYIKYTVKPMLISSLRRGMALAISMDSACFGIYKKRTYIHEVNNSRADFVFSAAISLLTVLIFYASFTGMLLPLFNFSETIKTLLFPSG